jgi:hypothetical protein
MASKTQHIRMLRLKVKNKAARPFAGSPKWLGASDLDKLTACASKRFERELPKSADASAPSGSQSLE